MILCTVRKSFIITAISYSQRIATSYPNTRGKITKRTSLEMNNCFFFFQWIRLKNMPSENFRAKLGIRCASQYASPDDGDAY